MPLTIFPSPTLYARQTVMTLFEYWKLFKELTPFDLRLGIPNSRGIDNNNSCALNSPIRYHSLLKIKGGLNIMLFVYEPPDMGLNGCSLSITGTFPALGIAEIYPSNSNPCFDCHIATGCQHHRTVIASCVVLAKVCRCKFRVLPL